jgi:nitric oxide reductase subunit B
MSTSSLKWGAVVSFIVGMSVLLWGGRHIRHSLPPYPEKVVTPDGRLLFDRATILRGQDVYQKYGLMDHGSVWGHGTLRGMDFSATTLHLIGQAMQAAHARADYARPLDQLDATQLQAVQAVVGREVKTNRYDSATDTLTLTNAQAAALGAVETYWENALGTGDKDYGFLPNTVKAPEERQDIARFFFWTAWVASANRPGEDYSYTNNWPPDPALGNTATPKTLLWSIGGLLSLFLVLGLIIYIVHRYRFFYGEPQSAMLGQRLHDLPLSVSQYKAAKFFLVVVLLFLVQTCLGGILAHYTVNPGSFYLPLVAQLIPYSLAKSWHLQLAIFWIATTWVGTAIYLAPLIGGREPRKQWLLVEILFGAVLLVAVGSITGELLGIRGILPGKLWFWLGHQGWEYLELGRLWQILLFVGLVAWLGIVYRALAGTIWKGGSESYGALVRFYTFSAILVVLFFGFGFFYHPGTHLTVADYWRWFVVHIWVESMFEFFGVAVVALFLTVLGLVSIQSALRVAYLTAILTFLSGIIGTAHHFYWYGGPALWLALGAVFSSMEPIPLILLVVRAWMEYAGIRKQGATFAYKWPLYFLTASSVWNFVGAGVFGFVINLPIVNYYEHGTYLTANHGHTALFGVYGMLSISLLLFTWRGLVDSKHWNDGILKVAFWGFNGGLFIMSMLTLLPMGLLQVKDSFTRGVWHARSAAFYNEPAVQLLGKLRMLPDSIVILVGVVPLAAFLFLTFRHLRRPQIGDGESVWEKAGISLNEKDVAAPRPWTQSPRPDARTV